MKRVKGIFARITAFLMMFTMLMGMMPANTAKAADLTLKFHYHRADGNYDGWDVWLWEYGFDGSGYAFNNEDGEMVATKTITPGTTQVGFIVRTTSWAKDISEDQYIDISEMISGTVHIYVESGVKGYTKAYGADSVTGVKVSQVKYESADKLSVVMTGTPEDITADSFTVTGPDGELKVSKVSNIGENSYLIILETEMDRVKNYTLTFDDTNYKITIPNIYSTAEFEEAYTYTGDDLGAVWSKDKTTFKVWAPTANELYVNLYETGTEGTDDLIEQIKMEKSDAGTWVAVKNGDLNGTYYTYSVSFGDGFTEVCDPYARTTGVNGKRAMVIDLDSTDPEGWDTDKDPNYDMPVNDAIIYELHIRDLSSSKSSGITNKRKYLGLTETGTTTSDGTVSTGLDHIKELGITHLHILPFYDFGSIDESKSSLASYNWGYDPVNYNVPEGSYSSDPYNGEVRVSEVKQMVKALHDNGISVVMDVVYNHVYSAADFCVNRLVPGYFSRTDENGKYSNGSGCGNDTATERSMVKKYIVDSVNYWADEYHIDGFRFDLVGLIDTETMNEIIETVHEKHPNVIFYGEGWTMSTTLTKDDYTLTTQVNSKKVPDMAFFSDDMRDTLKGNVFSTTSRGYVSGLTGVTDKIASCFKAQTTWSKNPLQMIQYASCHDNNTLIDRITSSAPNETRENQIRMNNLAAAIYLTSQGIPFMQAGEEMLRSKTNSDGTFNSNSYNALDNVNQLKWDNLLSEEYMNVFNYYKGLIAFRKAHAALRMSDSAEIAEKITRITDTDDNVVAMQISGDVENEISDGIIAIFNPNKESTEVTLPEGKWNICINDETAGTKSLKKVSGSVTVAPISAMVLVKGDCGDTESNGNSTLYAVLGVAGIAVLFLAAGFIVSRCNKKKKEN